MATPHQICIAHATAYQHVVDESLAQSEHETGGILIGRMFYLNAGAMLVVVAASGPGARAVLRGDMYVPDTAAHQNELEAQRREYAPYRVDYVGEWHKHAPGCGRPSAGDTLQVAEILGDAGYVLPDGIFTPITTVEGGAVLLHGYYYPRETLRAVPVECTIVNGDIRQLLEQLADLEQRSCRS
jgi:Prokaryotic homologs of the JAB domain